MLKRTTGLLSSPGAARQLIRKALWPLLSVLAAALCGLGGSRDAVASMGSDASGVVQAVEPPASSLLRQAAIGYEIYEVSDGDTLQNIAARFGVSPQQIGNLNSLAASSELTPGQSLAVPLPRGAASGRAQDASTFGSRSIQPCYAIVTGRGQITRGPTGARATQILYQPPLGSRLIVTADRGSQWGVVMIDGSTGWIGKRALRLTDEAIEPEQLEVMLSGGRPDIVQEALRYLGTPYRYGGRLPDGIDCSLLVQTVYAAHRISLPRTASSQFEVGRPVNYTELLPGDRLYFVGRSGVVNHTGIYLGAGQFVHASSLHGCVTIDELSERLYWTRFVGARRS